jgi:hypothetical protein
VHGARAQNNPNPGNSERAVHAGVRYPAPADDEPARRAAPAHHASATMLGRFFTAKAGFGHGGARSYPHLWGLMTRLWWGCALLVVFGLGVFCVRATVATGQGAVQVQETMDAVTLTFTNGHRIEWAKPSCGLSAWKDGRGVALGTGLDFQVEFPFGYEGQLYPSNTAYSRTTTQGESATIACTGTWGSHNNVPYRFTFSGQTREWGTTYNGVQWQFALDLPGVNTVELGIAALQPAGQPLGFRQWSNVPDNFGLQQVNYLLPEATIGHGDGQQTFSLLTHPQGVFIAFVPNFSVDRTNYTGFSSRPAYPNGLALYRVWEAPVSGQAAFTTPPFVYLFSDAAATRPIPQVWLDARFGTLHEQWRNLGLGRQHLHAPLDGNLTGGGYWADTHFPSYLQDFLAWGRYDGNRQFLTTGMFQGPRGGPSNINSTDQLVNPEYNLPNAEDLPAVIPGVTFPGQLPLQDPKGRGFTKGTIADLRAMLAHQRILGIRPGMWHREYYPACLPDLANPNNTTQWSRWDKTWTCSILWKFHPEWGQQLPDGSLDPAPQAFPNNRHPAYAAWKLAWHRYWLDLGLMGFFRDTAVFPAPGRVWYQRTFGSQGPAEWAYYVDLLRNGGAYVTGENPLLFSYAVGNRGNPKYDSYKEWASSFATGSWGGSFAGTNEYILDAEMAWDRRVARRSHTVVAANPCCEGDIQDISGPNMQSENRAENEYFAQFVARRGIPDRVELIAPRALPSRGTVLQQPVAASGGNVIYVDNPHRLPLSGRVQIGAERMLYTHPEGGPCGHWQVNYPCNGLGGIIRGYEGTPIQAHAVGDAVTPLDDAQHWDWGDAYWVYGQGAGEVWVKYSDGTVWQRGGTTAASVPQITGVQVSSSTIMFTTDVPTSAWVEYDTFGAAEQWNGQRVPGLPPMYQRRAPADGGDPPLQTQHQIALPGLQPGALYHYRIVTRGPAQATTADATFVAGQAPTPTLAATLIPTATPTRTATPLGTNTPTRTATPLATSTPASGVTFSTSPAIVAVGGTSTVTWSGVTDPGMNVHLERRSDGVWLGAPAFFLSCTQVMPSTAIPSGSCAILLTGLAPGPYRWHLLTGDYSTQIAVADFTLGATPVATPAPQPNVAVQVTPVAGTPGRLRVTVTPRDAGCSPNNRISSLRFTATTNATVDAGTVTGGTGDFTVPIAQSGPVTFFVNRVGSSAATVTLLVTDGCGTWPTFVGGGPGAF